MKTLDEVPPMGTLQRVHYYRRLEQEAWDAWTKALVEAQNKLPELMVIDEK